MVSLDIVIVNWNAGPQLAGCLNSIAATDRSSFWLQRVVVVDNASTDGSVDHCSIPGLPVVVIKNDKNLGFARACNQGASGTRADYLLFLNPDTLLFPDSLSIPLRFMEQPGNCHIGVAGVRMVNEKGETARTCSRLPTPGIFAAKSLGLDCILPQYFSAQAMIEWDHSSSAQVGQVIGAFFLVRSKLFHDLRGFDERFFVYFEEVDLSLRAQNLGASSYYLAEACIFHKGGGTSTQVKAKRLFYSLRSRVLYARKHFGKVSTAIVLVLTLFVEPFPRVVLAFAHRSTSEIRETVAGYLMFLGSFLSRSWRRA
jgi:N-acetylglucosaminyl-diphospho-decaprenol L-rhamnosyltransferase